MNDIKVSASISITIDDNIVIDLNEVQAKALQNRLNIIFPINSKKQMLFGKEKGMFHHTIPIFQEQFKPNVNPFPTPPDIWCFSNSFELY